MPSSITINYTFGSESGSVSATQLDSNFTQFVSANNSLNTFNTFFVDTGTANNLSFSVGSPLSVAYNAGLLLQVKVAATNTGASVVNVNALGNQSIVNTDGSALSAGQLHVGAISLLQYDGTNFQLLAVYGGAASTYMLKANNLSDVASASTSRTNLGVTATGADTTYNYRANNLSDVANAATARTNLGVTATGSDTTYNYRANNLSDVASASTARTNLGLGSLATLNTAAAANVSGGVLRQASLGSGVVTVQSGGSPSGGSDGDIYLIY